MLSSKVKKVDFSNMWKKVLVKFCGSIEHASSYFPVQLELYNTFLQEVAVFTILYRRRFYNVYVDLTMLTKMKKCDFSNMWKTFSVKIGGLVEHDHSCLPVQLASNNLFLARAYFLTNLYFPPSKNVYVNFQPHEKVKIFDFSHMWKQF